jgi:hypothetical protein
VGAWDKGELDRAVEAVRAEQAPEQAALFEPPAAEVAGPPAPRGRGRPAGARNLRSERYAALLRAELGDPLRAATRIAAIDILDPGNLVGLAKAWGCTMFEAAKLWAQINRDVLPYHHQQMPRAVVLPPGAPGGERVLIEIGGDFTAVSAAEEGEDAA